jgi:hypothetical protein
MNKKRATKKRWTVHREFEPNRLSADIMIQAYAQLIPPQVRVIRLRMNQTETSGGGQESRQGSRANKVEEEQPQCSNSNRHPEYSLVIGSITKKEAA